MMHFFRRSNQKQYDGPATDNVDSKVWEEELDRHRRPHSLSSSLHSGGGASLSRPTAMTSDKYYGKKNYDRNRRHRKSPRHDANNAPKLASGISSRRTSRRVEEHLPAHVMRSAMDNARKKQKEAMPNVIDFGTAKSNDGREKRRPPPSQKTQSTTHNKARPQIPMEHDGGVLCLAPIPDEYTPTAKAVSYDGIKTHRFLSGGADGTIKLWEVHERPMDDYSGGKDDGDNHHHHDSGGKGREMIPRLTRTYRGHTGYVHSIAVLGTLVIDPIGTTNEEETAPPPPRNNSSSIVNRRRATVSTMSKGIGRRMSHLSLDSSNSERRLGKNIFGKRLLFVSASRDNTLRVWSVDENNEHDAYFDDNNSGGGTHKKEDPFAKGLKLRGHQFGKDNKGGVLCVCAVPSLPSNDNNGDDNSVELDDSATSTDSTSATMSAGQFCSGGSDGLVRVWDIRSAVHSLLGRVPKSGMYGTVQLQCIGQDNEFRGGSPPAAITSLVCTHRGCVGKGEEVALFAGDAVGIIKRYSCKNEHGTGHVNSAIWWVCTGKFAGHTHPITGMSMLSSPLLIPLLCPNVDIDVDDEDVPGTMLVSSCKDGSICVWDAFDARINSQPNSSHKERQGNHHRAQGRILKRAAMWEIELNDSEDFGRNDVRRHSDRSSGRVGVTSLTTLQAGTLMAAGTTDGAIRMWNVSSGLYEGAYSIGKYVQIWSLGVLSEQETLEEYCREDEGEDKNEDKNGRDECAERVIRSSGLIVSGDNRGRIRVLRKMSSRVCND
mmetsp:Transcript_4807/g.10634  ORF Transcript_4807/g.10634 Transcript_4807/m.10634 type:complete len:771 (-) Transcript_4807:45-2357(-)